MGNGLKVLHLIDTGGPGGAETIFHRLVVGLEPRGWSAVPVVPVVDWLHGALREAGVEPLVLPHGGTADFRYLRRLRALVKDEGVALIHTHLLGSAVYGSLTGSLTGLPVVCTFHGEPDFRTGTRFLPLKLRLIQRERNRLVFVSHSLRESLVRRLGLDEGLCRVIHNGMAFEEPRLLGTERHELGANPGDFLAVAVGNLRPAKDYGTLLQAVARVRAGGLPLHLAIVGEGSGPLRQELEFQRSELGLDEAVVFTGFRADASRLLAAADVYVSSSSTEGFSLSTVEALWLARPVVATRSGGPEEIVRHGETGLLVPTRSPEALAGALQQIYHRRAAAEAGAQAGRAAVQQRFGVDTMLARYEALYEELLR